MTAEVRLNEPVSHGSSKLGTFSGAMAVNTAWSHESEILPMLRPALEDRVASAGGAPSACKLASASEIADLSLQVGPGLLNFRHWGDRGLAATNGESGCDTRVCIGQVAVAR
jgi:hypothetical protein